MSRPGRKPHLCPLCNVQIYEVDHVYPKDSYRAGEPTKGVGPPIGRIKRVGLVLAAGQVCNTTVCEECEVTPENLPMLWIDQCIAQTASLNPDWRRATPGLNPLTEDESRTQMQSLAAFIDNVPLGVIAVQPWENLLNGR